MSDPVKTPAHYVAGTTELINVTENLDFCRGNAVKYIVRADKKGDELQDLLKARQYINRAINKLRNQPGWEPWDND